MRVLVIDEWLPVPMESGKKIRTYQLLTPLAKNNDITYLCYADPQAEAGKIAQMVEAGFNVRCVPPANRFRTRATLAAGLATNLFLRIPLAVRKHYSRRYHQAIQDLLAKKNFDIVHCEWTHYAYYLRKMRHLPKFLSTHNVESMQWQRFSQVQTNPFRKAAIHLEWLKMRAFEHQMVGQFDHVAVVSAADAQIMKSWFDAQSVEVIPNGVDSKHYDRADGRHDGHVLVYCASMDSFVNQDAAMYFAKNIFPMIRSKMPQARFLIVGRGPPASIRKLADTNITVSGSVEDVRPLLATASISIVPLRIAGGSRLKILEAFAAGIPVVSTSIGAEGLDVDADTHLLIADDESAFASHCLRLLEEPLLAARLTEAAKSLVDEKYDWRTISPLLGQAWERTVEIHHFTSSKQTASNERDARTAPCAKQGLCDRPALATAEPNTPR
jgi:polysaccharide biosynthesis protein PslH